MNRPIVIAVMAASLLIADTALAAVVCPPADPKKTTVCHVQEGNPTKKQTLCIGNAAVRAHLNNHPGDSVGPCGSTSCGNGICEANLGETSGNCVEDCGCDCQAAVNVTGIAVDLGTVLGVGIASLTGDVCSTCNANGSSITLAFTPSIEEGSTAFTFVAGAVGGPQCELIDDIVDTLGTVIVSGKGTITSGSQQQPTTFTLTLVKVAGLVCTSVLNLDSTTVLGIPSLTVPVSIPCGDSVFQTCPAL